MFSSSHGGKLHRHAHTSLGSRITWSLTYASCPHPHSSTSTLMGLTWPPTTCQSSHQKERFHILSPQWLPSGLKPLAFQVLDCEPLALAGRSAYDSNWETRKSQRQSQRERLQAWYTDVSGCLSVCRKCVCSKDGASGSIAMAQWVKEPAARPPNAHKGR